jgi:hypothetical protein
MVSKLHTSSEPVVLSAFVVAAAAPPQLPPPTRAAAMMALVGIALVGMLLVAVILLGGNWVRRQGRHRRKSVVPPDRAPIHPRPTPQSDSPSTRSAADTIADESSLGDTQV